MSAAPHVHPLYAAGSAFFVGRRPVITGWRLWVARKVYFWLGVSDVEGETICTSKKAAAELAKKPGWFFMELPINVQLPEETCQYGLHSFPASRPNDYPHRHLKMVAVNRADMGRRGSDETVGVLDRFLGWCKCFKRRRVNQHQSSTEGLLDCLGQWVKEARREAESVNSRLERIEHELASHKHGSPDADD